MYAGDDAGREVDAGTATPTDPRRADRRGNGGVRSARLRRRGARGDRRDRRLHPRRIYKNFDDKEALFFAVTDRLNEQVIEAFRTIAPESASPDDWDIARLAQLWRTSVEGEFEDVFFAIGKEYELYVLRNPDARPRAVAHRRRQRDLVASFIDEVAEQSGMTLRLPSATLAAIILAAADGLTYTAHIDGEDLFAPFLELLNAGMITD